MNVHRLFKVQFRTPRSVASAWP